MKSGITMLIYNKNNIEFVTPCLLGHHVQYKCEVEYKNILRYNYLLHTTSVARKKIGKKCLKKISLKNILKKKFQIF